MAKVKSLKFDSPHYQVWIDWDITQRCNYTCSYCASYNNDQPFNFKPLEEYIKALTYVKSLFSDNETIMMHFLGGEPTLYKQWPELFSWLADNRFMVQLTTNLSIPAKKYINRLSTNLSQFMIGSYHPEFANFIKFRNNVKMLHDKGFYKQSVVLGSPKYWDHIMDVFNSLSEICDTRLTKIKDEHAGGRLRISGGWIDYTEEQAKMFIDVNPQEDKYMTVVFDDGTIAHPTNSVLRYYHSSFKGMFCAVGQKRLHINSYGDVFPSACLLNFRKAIMGNIYKQNIRKPQKAITCPFEECLCGPDIRIEKWAQG